MFREIRTILRARVLPHVPLAVVIFFVPVFYTLLFGAVYARNTVSHIPLAVLDEDQSAVSRSLIRMYADSEKFDILLQTAEQEEVEAALKEGEVLTALEIPRDFAEDVKAGRQPTVGFVVNSSNNVFGNVAMLAAWEIHRSFSVALGEKLVEAMNVLPKEALGAVYPVAIGIRVLGNPTGGFPAFILTGLSANGTQIALMMTLPPLLLLMLERRPFSRREAPVVLAAYLLTFFLLGLGALLLSLFLAVTVYGIPMRGSVGLLVLLSAAFLFFVVGVLLFFAALSPDAVMAAQLPLFYIMPSILYSGITWPESSMTAGASFYASLMPMRYYAGALRALLLYGDAPGIWAAAGQMAVYGAASLAGASLAFLWRWRGRRHAGREAA